MSLSRLAKKAAVGVVAVGAGAGAVLALPVLGGVGAVVAGGAVLTGAAEAAVAAAAFVSAAAAAKNL